MTSKLCKEYKSVYSKLLIDEYTDVSQTFCPTFDISKKINKTSNDTNPFAAFQTL